MLTGSGRRDPKIERVRYPSLEGASKNRKARSGSRVSCKGDRKGQVEKSPTMPLTGAVRGWGSQTGPILAPTLPGLHLAHILEAQLP